jgi:hypothetical protein
MLTLWQHRFSRRAPVKPGALFDFQRYTDDQGNFMERKVGLSTRSARRWRHAAMFVAIVTCLGLDGCGAGKAVNSSAQDTGALEINPGESISIIMGDYIDDNFEKLPPGEREQVRDSIENKFFNCLEKQAGLNRRPIKVIPGKSARKYFRNTFGVELDDTPMSDIFSRMENGESSVSPGDLKLRYLFIADITTRRTGEVEPTLEGDQGLFILGMSKGGLKNTRASVHVVDLANLTENELLNSYSEGKEGWAAGVVVILIIPVPYVIPWWANTESEVCDSIGRSIIDLLAVRQ